MNRVKAIAKKEVKQLLRDKKFLSILFFFPVFLLAIFGYAVNFDVKHISLAVLDKSNSFESRQFIASLTHAEYFDIKIVLKSEKEINQVLDKGETQAVMVIPKDFSGNLVTGKKTPQIQFLIDGVNGNTATIIKNYLTLATFNYGQKYQAKILRRFGKTQYIPVSLETRFMFNPELKTTKFLIPGLIGMILIITAVISVSLTMVREKEQGTIEQINVSSVKPLELIFGKSLPYLLISLSDAVIVLIAGYILFGVTVVGSYWLLFITTIIFLFTSISVGIFISTVAESQQVAFTVATFFSLLPSFILSGFVFPIDSMPKIIQIITNITPVKFYLVAMRAIMLRGVGLSAFWQQLIYLLIFSAVFILLATVVGHTTAKNN